jgi:hypothetical protein
MPARRDCELGLYVTLNVHDIMFAVDGWPAGQETGQADAGG